MAAITTAGGAVVDSNSTAAWSGGVVPTAVDTVTIAHPGTNTFSSTAYSTTGALAIGATSIPVSGGAGTIVAGEWIVLEHQTGTDADGYPIFHTDYYLVTTGIAGNGTLAIPSPGLLIAIQTGTRVLNCGHRIVLGANHVWGGDTGGGMVVNGTLQWPTNASRTLTVRANYAVNGSGTEDRGSPGRQISASNNAVLLLNDSASPAVDKYAATYAGGCRVLHAGANRKRWTQTAAAVSAGATALSVAESDGWAAGDRLLVFPTGGAGNAELRTIAAGWTNGLTVALSSGITTARTPGAHVVNLTSNVATRQAGAFGFGTVMVNAASTGRQYDKRLSNSEWRGDSQGLRVSYLVSQATAAGQPAQWLSTDSVFESAANGGHAVGAWNFSFPRTNGLPLAPARRCIFVANGGGGALGGINSGAFDRCVAASGGNITSPAIQQVTGSNVNLPYANGSFVNGLLYSVHTGDHGSYIAMTSGSFDNNILLDGFRGNAALVAAAIYCPGGLLQRNNFAPYGIANSSRSFVALNNAGNTRFVDTQWGAANDPFTYGSVSGVLIESWFGRYTGTADSPRTEAWANTGYYRSSADQRRNGRVSLKLTNRYALLGAAQALTRSIALSIPANSTRLLLANLRRSSSGAMPTLTISGPGITTVTSSVGNTADAWLIASMNVTNPTSAAVQATLTYSVSGAVGTDSWVDGVADYPYVDAVRWYGFVFDEANPFRVADPTITLTEAQAAAVTGVAINHTAGTITVTAARTAAEIGCFAKLDLVNNLDASGNYRTNHITIGADGNSFATTYTVVIGSGGSISGRYSDANGSVVSIALTNLVPNSSVLIIRTDTNAELARVVAPGTSYSLNLATATSFPTSVRVVAPVGPPHYQPWETSATVDAIAGVSLRANNLTD